MAREKGIGITKRMVDALSVDNGDTVFWDRDHRGFGVRVHATGRKAYVVQTRGPAGRLKRVTVGRHGEMTADAARRAALRVAVARVALRLPFFVVAGSSPATRRMSPQASALNRSTR